ETVSESESEAEVELRSEPEAETESETVRRNARRSSRPGRACQELTAEKKSAPQRTQRTQRKNDAERARDDPRDAHALGSAGVLAGIEVITVILPSNAALGISAPSGMPGCRRANRGISQDGAVSTRPKDRTVLPEGLRET